MAGWIHSKHQRLLWISREKSMQGLSWFQLNIMCLQLYMKVHFSCFDQTHECLIMMLSVLKPVDAKSNRRCQADCVDGLCLSASAFSRNIPAVRSFMHVVKSVQARWFICRRFWAFGKLNHISLLINCLLRSVSCTCESQFSAWHSLYQGYRWKCTVQLLSRTLSFVEPFSLLLSGFLVLHSKFRLFIDCSALVCIHFVHVSLLLILPHLNGLISLFVQLLSSLSPHSCCKQILEMFPVFVSVFCSSAFTTYQLLLHKKHWNYISFH